MADQRSYQLYKTQQVMTASPAKLIAMLFDKATASLRDAIAAIDAGDVERRWRANNRAVEIITHLWSTLDEERGGEIAANLAKLYRFILRLLLEVDFKNSKEAAENAIRLIEPLRESWDALAKSAITGGPHRAASATDAAEHPQSPPNKRISLSA